ncbi:MAG: hypothetical protein KGZ30_02105 [Anaplasmataceae bacterium]|nr:hypothetical protein [Anaplasmataceae bacterium]
MDNRYDEILKEVVTFEKYMALVHDGKRDDISPEVLKESRRIGKSWFDMAMFSREALSLSLEEYRELEALFEDLLLGNLNQPTRRSDLEKLIQYKLRYEKSALAQSNSKEKIVPSWRRKLRLVFLIFLILLICTATFVYLRLISLIAG